MLAPIGHRGPDGTGTYTDARIALGHARLSIIDLEGGSQPIQNEDGTLWTSFNGEIFNYIELRQELVSAGHVFRTRTDTEVIVHGYEEWGDDFVHRLNGQFAIALWDGRRARLTLYRDRAGILPLYHTRVGGRLLFASEMKSLLAVLPEAPRLDLVGLDQIFTGWSTVAPRTPFESISELPPGHRLTLEDGCVTVEPYWDWAYPADGEYRRGTDRELAAELRELLIDATRMRLRADVPVGAYLSGGLDSSALVGLMRRHSDARLQTFSIGFSAKEFDEGEHQQRLVDYLGVPHVRIHCDPASIGAELFTTVRHAEMPLLRTAPAPMGMLSRAVHAYGYKVVLTGEGADEVFGGYDIFKEAKIRRFWARQPDSRWRPLLLRRLYPWLPSTNQGLEFLKAFYGVGLENPESPLFSHLPRFATTSHAKQFYSEDVRARLSECGEEAFAALLGPESERWHSFHRAQRLEARSLMSGYLLNAQGDRMLMASSVEGRFPYLDHRVIEFAARLDPRVKMRVLREKHLLRHAVADYLPPAILEREKQPYRAPDAASLFATPDLPWVQELLAETKLREYGYFDPERVRLLVGKGRAGRASGARDNMALVGIATTQLWHYHFIERFRDWRNP